MCRTGPVGTREIGENYGTEWMALHMTNAPRRLLSPGRRKPAGRARRFGICVATHCWVRLAVRDFPPSATGFPIYNM